MVKGNEVIPAQVIKVPKGSVSWLSNANVSSDEPDTKRRKTQRVQIRAQ